jgi:protein-disulfide isomerase
MGTRILIVVLFVLSVLTSSALTYLMLNKSGASAAGGDIGAEIEKFIEENPEAIINGLRKAQMARQEQEEQELEKNATELRPQLEQNPADAQAGNKDGDVVFVAFHDHNCGYCRKSIADIEKLLSEDKGIKFVLKDFPILGPSSVEKAKASIAVAKLAPEKWYTFYDKMGHSNARTAEQIFELAEKELGISPALLKSEMESKATENKITENHALGEQLNISGTPVFIVNGIVVRGAVGLEAFKEAVAAARANKS